MKEGSKRSLSIPSALGYGAEGSPGKIPPNTDLYFDVELVKVLKEDEMDLVTFEILKPGTGRGIKDGDVVTIEYHGTTLDGEEVDSSKSQGKPATFTVGKQQLMAKGLEDGMKGAGPAESMKLGEKRRITLPPGMGMPGDWDSTLQTFEVTLKSIK
jgi:FKBP-type peptidyl-prolyl cis-trans isomerase